MRFPEPQRTEIDGVPVWYTDVPGPCLAGLIFRVGVCDETQADRGISHLVEHLALHPLASARFDMNGSVGLLMTSFYVAGTQEEAERFLEDLCGRLSHLPLDRLDLERRVLQTEAIRGSGSAAGSLSLRFGEGSFGMGDWTELGLQTLTDEQTASWSGERFNRSNAVLWITRPPSDTLRLPLPAGVAFPPPPIEVSPHLATPSHLHTTDPYTILCSMLVRRSMPSYVALVAARERIFTELRLERGLSYSAQWWEDRLGPRDSLMTISTDFAEGHEREALARFSSILEAVAGGELTQTEVEYACESSMPWSSNHPNRPAAEVARKAIGDLIGHAPTTWADLEAQARDVDPANVAGAFSDALETAILVVPDDLEPEGRFSGEPGGPPSRRMRGRLYVRWDGNRVDEVIAGPHGVSRSLGIRDVSSVSYDDCVVATISPQGTMWLFGRWGGRVGLDLNALRHGHELAAIIRERVGDRFVDLKADAIGWFSMQSIIESHDIKAVARMWRELELLATSREVGERILAVAFAEHRGRGILAATDRRVLHLVADREPSPSVELSRATVRDVRVASGLRGARVEIVADGGVAVFERIRPRSQAAEFELILAPVGDDSAS